ncbi:hypothetical protein J2T15_001844 [Paenibacillus harenae]|uniref:Uncharacterized protein n=1 Tax=Paenibacillus harenae TaxID=306543 RepID=A0ABT9U1T9_PAEHA|nr:hypothetical protein [Paenibacillus harenae]
MTPGSSSASLTFYPILKWTLGIYQYPFSKKKMLSGPSRPTEHLIANFNSLYSASETVQLW